MVPVLGTVVVEAPVPHRRMLPRFVPNDGVGITHAQGIEYAGLDGILVWPAVHCLEQKAEGLIADIGIPEVFSRRSSRPAFAQGPCLVQAVAPDVGARNQA